MSASLVLKLTVTQTSVLIVLQCLIKKGSPRGNQTTGTAYVEQRLMVAQLRCPPFAFLRTQVDAAVTSMASNRILEKTKSSIFVQSQIVSSVIERPRIAESLAPKALVQVQSRMLTQHAVSSSGSEAPHSRAHAA